MEASHLHLSSRAIIASLTNTTCPLTNSQNLDASSFWDSSGLHWDAHRIGWAIAGGCTVLTFLLGGTNIWLHCRNYRKPYVRLVPVSTWRLAKTRLEEEGERVKEEESS